MSQLKDKAEKLRSHQQSQQEKEQQMSLQKLHDDTKRLVSEFEEAFVDVLPMLKEEGISYSAHFNRFPYGHLGTYILFQKGVHHLKMDFSNRNSYRYEYIPYNEGRSNYGTMQYGKWDMDKFIVWIYEKLASLSQPEPEELIARAMMQSIMYDSGSVDILHHEEYPKYHVRKITEAIKEFQRTGPMVDLTNKDVVDDICNGEETEVMQGYGHLIGFKQLHQALNNYFNGEEEEPDWNEEPNQNELEGEPLFYREVLAPVLDQYWKDVPQNMWNITTFYNYLLRQTK